MKKTFATAAIVGFAALTAQANPTATAPAAAPVAPAAAPAAQSAPATAAPAKSDVVPGTAVATVAKAKRHKKHGTDKK